MTHEYPETDAEWIERLTEALLTGDDETFPPSKAAMYLNMDYPEEAFPIHDPDNDRWILKAERETLDGTGFIGTWIEVRDGEEPCPDCGNTRVKHSSFNNGIVGGFRDVCTICGRCHAEDAG